MLETLPTSTQCNNPKAESTSTEFPFTIMWQVSLQVHIQFILLYIFSLTIYILCINNNLDQSALQTLSSVIIELGVESFNFLIQKTSSITMGIN
jgi:hypothetical protein